MFEYMCVYFLTTCSNFFFSCLVEVDLVNLQYGAEEVQFTVRVDTEKPKIFCCLYKDQQGLYSLISPYLDLDDHNGQFVFDGTFQQSKCIFRWDSFHSQPPWYKIINTPIRFTLHTKPTATCRCSLRSLIVLRTVGVSSSSYILQLVWKPHTPSHTDKPSNTTVLALLVTVTHCGSAPNLANVYHKDKQFSKK